MEKNKVIDVGETKKFKMNGGNLKPFLSVFIVLILLIAGYYFIWRGITVRVKNIVTDSLKDFKYDSITVSGFPFSKTIKVSNITFTNDDFLVTKNQINVKEIMVSSFIFGSKMNIKLNNITTVDINNNLLYSLNYNEQPEINISFYSSGDLRSFQYSDMGYRVVSSDNKTLYTADKSNVNIESVMNDNTIDYSIQGEFQKMQNISITESKNELSIQNIPEIYSMKFDISSSITKANGEIRNSIIKINDFELTNEKNNNLKLTGQMFREPGDMYTFGDLKFVMINYNDIIIKIKENVLEALKIENANLSVEEQKEYIDITNKIFNAIDVTIKKNPETKDNIGVVVLSRKKGVPDYIINGESLFGIIQQIIK